MSTNNTSSICWEFRETAAIDLRPFIDQYASKFDRITQDGFGGQANFTPHKLNESIGISTHVGFLGGLSNPVGFTFICLPSPKLYGLDSCYINKIVIKKKYHGSGLGGCGAIVKSLNDFLPEKKVGWLIGRTQNPGLIRSFIKIAKRNYPFQTPYYDDTNETGIGLLQYGVVNIPQLQQPYRSGISNGKNFVFRYGIDKGVYKRQLGNFDVKYGNPEAEAKLEQWKFDRKAGDAVLMFSQI